MKNRNTVYLIVVMLGLFQSIGYLCHMPLMKKIGLLTVASPLPLVFGQVKGVETFASDFYLNYQNTQNQQCQVKITPKLYAKLKGPYQYRNVVGAAISYGPVLPKKIVQAVLHYHLVEPGTFAEIVSEPYLITPSIIVKTRTYGRKDVWVLKP